MTALLSNQLTYESELIFSKRILNYLRSIIFFIDTKLSPVGARATN